MRVLAIPAVAMLLTAGTYSDEPTEQQMRVAFERTLTEQVRGAVAYVAETGGPEAVEKVRLAGTDRFEVRGFRKLACNAVEDGGYRCTFSVDLDVINGELHRRMNGRFFGGPNGLSFASEV
jgi:hypothetical protein